MTGRLQRSPSPSVVSCYESHTEATQRAMKSPLRAEPHRPTQSAESALCNLHAAAQRIEEALAGRQGRPEKTCKHLQDYPEPQGNSRDLAASAVGWSGEQYRQAKHVMAEADDETKEAVDSGAVSVNKAYRKTRGRSAPKAITVRLAYDVEPDANVIIAKSGGEYATRLAMKILEIEGHEVNYEK